LGRWMVLRILPVRPGESLLRLYGIWWEPAGLAGESIWTVVKE
jgi:hypothetical protein